jgi:hypothetical protein
LILTIDVDPRERRLVLRVLAYWRDLVPEDGLPAAHSIQPADIAELWPACFTLDLSGEKPIFSYLGETHVAHFGRDLGGLPVEEAGTDTLLGRATEYLDEVLTRKIPITYGGTFTGADGEPVLYRSILLPLADEGEEINGILGAANCNLAEFE